MTQICMQPRLIQADFPSSRSRRQARIRGADVVAIAGLLCLAASIGGIWLTQPPPPTVRCPSLDSQAQSRLVARLEQAADRRDQAMLGASPWVAAKIGLIPETADYAHAQQAIAEWQVAEQAFKAACFIQRNKTVK